MLGCIFTGMFPFKTFRFLLASCVLLAMSWPALSQQKIISGIVKTIDQKRVTYDLERQMEGATKLKTSEFGDAIIENM